MKTVYLLFVLASALIEVGANLMLEKSDGFRRRAWGIGAILLVWLAFALLGQAVKGMDLAIAYALWGSIGILGTAIGGRLLYKQKLKPIGWAGIGIVAAAVVTLSTV
ncbi:multidrug efflux SMR transporter [Chromobacterium vaccinii]|uniref:Spermidine export protein MdtI n=4 Tax=Chromobacteriaceae TaxID=1499392 RepID=A0ABV0FC67_9NEIS|nr:MULTISPECIES: multidrug efflux SMR transporter [Chromobacteriaceae]AVG16216.1 QacE family quaternary ammonium compound efflux SMR transporter [Chromobacterium vaccinii]AXE30890.1 QacE family quaternary ammonium compound efflux SMR transporter [Chromobacterium phragmitis]ERE06967.1 multidrug transporter [Pseudogulbenkiania ferrooxidans EGD-HP2]MBX9296594.1 multidrug efflux SMR transporter [Chromobacterium vaccinii]MBX9348582.1 multidrug efflux SMR transporter [Chromobacterium vaccinii]